MGVHISNLADHYPVHSMLDPFQRQTLLVNAEQDADPQWQLSRSHQGLNFFRGVLIAIGLEIGGMLVIISLWRLFHLFF